MLTLEELLPIVQKKYKEAYINPVIDNPRIFISKDENVLDNFEISRETYNKFIIFNRWSSSKRDEYIKNNIIELKHYLDIDIEWEDLVEYIRKIIDFEFTIKSENFIFNDLIFYKNGNVETMEDYTIATNRSYWQMYQILKNLTENYGK